MAELPSSLEALIALGDRERAAGRLAQATAAYERALALDPDAPEAHNGLGTVCMMEREVERGVAHYRRAIAVAPDFYKAHNNLGNALQAAGDLDGAIAAYRRAIALDPGAVKPLSNLGNALGAKGRLAEAAASYRRALAIDPSHFAALTNLGLVLQSLGNMQEAVDILQRAADVRPGAYEALCNLGSAQHAVGALEAAIANFRAAAELRAKPVEALCCMGAALEEAKRPEEAIACLQTALKHDPSSFAALNCLGNLFEGQGAIDEALSFYGQARDARPDMATAHNNLGNTWLKIGETERALACYEQAVAIAPGSSEMWSNMLFSLHYDPKHGPEAIFAAHRAFGERFEAAAPLPRRLRAGRKLRIGYVSPDFRNHSVAYFIEPVLARHDRRRFEVYCYANVARPDATTQRFTRYAAGWRHIAGMNVDVAAELIRADEIDILVDLAGHTARNSAELFARRLAPVQATYLGYPDTTGLATVDHRLTDAFADPPGQTERWHTEALLRLPSTAWCYRPPDGSPAPTAPPSLRRGAVTFGSFNNVAKISADVAKLWCRILESTPKSRLFLKNRVLASRRAREHLVDLFAREGIGPERLELAPWSPSREGHLAAYSEVDIALDTFPYHGTTTTCEALWMGVPVVVLEGRTHVSRVGVSLLTNAGLADWIASSPDDYVRRATEAAADIPRLAELRGGLRERLARSPLMDEKRFVLALEDAFQRMWDEASDT